MNKLVTWLGGATITLAVVACGGKVIVDGPGENSGGAPNTTTTTTTTTSSGTQPGCGDIVLPSPADLTGCSAGVTTGSGMTTCESDMCDSNGNIYGAICTGSTCSCQLNGFTKCGCTTEGVTDFCAAGPACCPWIPIAL